MKLGLLPAQTQYLEPVTRGPEKHRVVLLRERRPGGRRRVTGKGSLCIIVCPVGTRGCVCDFSSHLRSSTETDEELLRKHLVLEGKWGGRGSLGELACEQSSCTGREGRVCRAPVRAHGGREYSWNL